jgi:maltodextrin utilization protein YvdJ
MIKIRKNSRLRRLRSFSESEDFLLNLGRFMAPWWVDYQ